MKRSSGPGNDLAASNERLSGNVDRLTTSNVTLTGSNRDFKAFLAEGPSLDGLDLTRDRTPMREDSTRKADA